MTSSGKAIPARIPRSRVGRGECVDETREKYRETETEADRQTDTEIDRQTDRQTVI